MARDLLFAYCTAQCGENDITVTWPHLKPHYFQSVSDVTSISAVMILRGEVESCGLGERRCRQAAECGAQAALCPCAPSPVRKKEKAPSGVRPLPQPTFWGVREIPLAFSSDSFIWSVKGKKVKHLSPSFCFLPSPILWWLEVAPSDSVKKNSKFSFSIYTFAKNQINRKSTAKRHSFLSRVPSLSVHWLFFSGRVDQSTFFTSQFVCWCVNVGRI